jgi:hypothetical protein
MNTLRMFLALPLAAYVAITGLPLIEPVADNLAALFSTALRLKAHCNAASVATLVVIELMDRKPYDLESILTTGWMKTYGQEVAAWVILSCLGICIMTCITPCHILFQLRNQSNDKGINRVLFGWAVALSCAAWSLIQGGSTLSMELKLATLYAWGAFAFVVHTARELALGDVVEVFGLTSEQGKDLNGRSGKIGSYNKEKKRYEISLGDRVVSLKLENLRRVNSAGNFAETILEQPIVDALLRSWNR